MSKKLLLVILIPLLVIPVLGYVMFSNISLPSNELSSNSFDQNKIAGDLNIERSSPFSKDKMAVYFEPKRIRIDAINLNSIIQNIGVDEKGTLGVPTNWTDVGWYKDGTKPGENGNLIIAAHYDTNTGAPAAFWQLKNVKVDDTVSLVDEYGREYAYSVTDSFYVDIQDPTRLEIFSDTSDPTITLITCGGIWIPGEGYSRRLVLKGLLLD